MLTAIIAFAVIFLCIGAFGIILKIAFHIFKWIFLGIIGLGAFILFFAFAVPLIIILPVAAVIFALYILVAH